MTDKVILAINNLKVVYKTDLDTVHAVNGINLSIKKGRTHGLVGETGAGKTTTALALMQLLPSRTGRIENGSILFEGENLLERKPYQMQEIRGRLISMIFQDPMTSLNPVMTVGEQIAEVIRNHDAAFESNLVGEKVDHILTMVGIPPERKVEYPHQFSGGMRQRIIIAMALVCEPKLVIADEPTTALDVTIQAQVLKMIRDLKQRMGTSMLLITHDLGVVAKTCDDVSIMYAGEIVESGTIEDVYSHQKHHPYTQGLFNSIPNLKENKKRLRSIPGLMPDPTQLAKGCVFCPRCKEKMPICERVKPEAIWFGSHQISCHLWQTKGEVDK